MNPTLRTVSAVVFLGGLVPANHPAQAETYNTCAGFIDSLPATISTQGTWCMRRDLSTAMASGAAITIATNNVTIDCNHFKLGGLAAGAGTATTGIESSGRSNAEVRNCNVRGFQTGVHLSGGSGHAVLDSRFDNNTIYGILIYGEGLVQGNRVLDTGGANHPATIAIGMAYAYNGAVVDNVVQGVYSATGSFAYGLLIDLPSGDVSGNSISMLVPGAGGEARGIENRVADARMVIRDNVISAYSTAPVAGIGVACNAAGIARDNTISGLTTGISGCADAGGNFSN